MSTPRRRPATRRTIDALSLRPRLRRHFAGLITGLLLVLLAVTVLGPAEPAGAMRTSFREGDDWRHLWALLDQFKKSPPKVPVVYLLGGSTARECTTLDGPWSEQVSRLVGRRLRAVNLGTSKQTYRQDLDIVDLLPAAPSIVLVGVNLGRFATPPPKSGAALTTGSDSILTSYTQHRFSAGSVMSDAAKRIILKRWLVVRYPLFKRNYAYDLRRLELIIAECQRLGQHPVLVNLPVDNAIVSPALDAPRARYARGCRTLAAEYHIRYFDFVGQVGFVSRDFADLWHCVPSGRVKFQARLSRVVHTLVDRYGLGQG
jgi:hypothetical protein